MARKTLQEKKEEFLRICAEEFHRTRGEEWANGITHIVGIVFGVVAITMMLVISSLFGNAWHIVSSAIYGATLLMLTFSSAMYHLLVDWRAKRVFQIFDHCTIYFLIAGSYTPLLLVTMNHSPIAWTMFGIEWGLTLAGVIIETLFYRIVKYASLPIYLVMGWLILLNFKVVYNSMDLGGLVLLAVGGLVYTLGVIFYVMDRVPYMHTVWHVFVLGGIVCQWVSIMFYVIPWSEQA